MTENETQTIELFDYVGSEKRWNNVAKTKRLTIVHNDAPVVEFGGQDVHERLVWLRVDFDVYAGPAHVEAQALGVDPDDLEGYEWAKGALWPPEPNQWGLMLQKLDYTEQGE